MEIVWNPSKKIWNPSGKGMESIWKRYGIHLEKVWNPSGKGMESIHQKYGIHPPFHGIHPPKVWNPSPIPWNPSPIPWNPSPHSMEFLQSIPPSMDSTWNNPGRVKYCSTPVWKSLSVYFLLFWCWYFLTYLSHIIASSFLSSSINPAPASFSFFKKTLFFVLICFLWDF